MIFTQSLSLGLLPIVSLSVSLSSYAYVFPSCHSIISLFRLKKNRELFENFRILKFSCVDFIMSNSSIEYLSAENKTSGTSGEFHGGGTQNIYLELFLEREQKKSIESNE